MKEERIPMGQKELHRWQLMKMLEAGKIGVFFRQGGNGLGV
jgi:hypothetical protein